MTLLVIAALAAVALTVSRLTRRVAPEIVIFLVLGVLIGPEGPWPVITNGTLPALERLTDVGLGAIIFLIGDRLRLQRLAESKQALTASTVWQLLLTAALVYVAARIAGAPGQVAAILSVIAIETGVLTVTATVNQESARGRSTELLLRTVAVTNVAAAIVFALAFPVILAASGEMTSLSAMGALFGRIVVASASIGVLGGWMLRTVAKRTERSGELLLIVLVAVTAVVGAARAIEGSVVVAALAAGLYVANTAPILADRAFAAVRFVEAPIYLVFFVVAGASIHLDELAGVGAVGAAYLVARTIGKISGPLLGSTLSRGAISARQALTVGIGLLPHAGMALALVAFVAESSERLGSAVSPVVLASIVVFELLSPVPLRAALRRSGETPASAAQAGADAPPGRRIERVLVPVTSDGAPASRVEFVLTLAKSMSAEVVALHVTPNGPPVDDFSVFEGIRAAADESGVDVTPVIMNGGDVARTIVAAAREHRVDAILIGAPVRVSAFERPRWGSIPHRVVRYATVPVLVFPLRPSDVD